MKKKLITLLMIVTLLMGMTTIFASATTQLSELEPVDLGDFNWDNLGSSEAGNQLGWYTVEAAAHEKAENDLDVESNGLTTGQLTKATHLVLELSEAPSENLQIVWQSDIVSAGAWNQSDIPLDDLLLMLDGNTLTIPLPYYLKDYPTFFSNAVKNDNFIDALYGALLEDEDIETWAKICLGYWGADLREWIVSAKLTYERVGRPANENLTYDLMPHLTPGVAGNFAFTTQYHTAAGDGTPGVTLLKSLLQGARGMTIVVDKELEEGTPIDPFFQSPAGSWGWNSANEGVGVAYDYYWDEDAGLGYIDFWFSAHPGFDGFADPDDTHGKLGFMGFGTEDDPIDFLGITDAYIWWALPVRGEVEEPVIDEPVIDEPGDEPGDEPDTPDAPPPAPPVAPPADSGGLDTWVWILIIGGGVVVVAVVIILVVKGKK